jgi:hypothetical protein
MTEEEFKSICQKNGLHFIEKNQTINVMAANRYGEQLIIAQYFKEEISGWNVVEHLKGSAIILNIKEIRSIDGYLVNFECGDRFDLQYKEYTKAFKFDRDLTETVKKIKLMLNEIKKTEILWDFDND